MYSRYVTLRTILVSVFNPPLPWKHGISLPEVRRLIVAVSLYNRINGLARFGNRNIKHPQRLESRPPAEPTPPHTREHKAAGQQQQPPPNMPATPRLISTSVSYTASQWQTANPKSMPCQTWCSRPGINPPPPHHHPESIGSNEDAYSAACVGVSLPVTAIWYPSPNRIILSHPLAFRGDFRPHASAAARGVRGRMEHVVR